MTRMDVAKSVSDMMIDELDLDATGWVEAYVVFYALCLMSAEL